MALEKKLSKEGSSKSDKNLAEKKNLNEKEVSENHTKVVGISNKINDGSESKENQAVKININLFIIMKNDLRDKTVQT